MKFNVFPVSVFLIVLSSAPFALAQNHGRKYRDVESEYHGYYRYARSQSYYYCDNAGMYGHRYAGLPPGLAKKYRLPPGLAIQLMERGSLPPGLQKNLGPYPQYYGSPYHIRAPRRHSVRIFLEF